MNGRMGFAKPAVLITVLAGVALTGCAAGNSIPAASPGVGSVAGPGGAAGAGQNGDSQWMGPTMYRWDGQQWSGPGMMDGQMSGYRFSRPSCTVPQTLPGTVVSVMVGDMGMSQMMGGDAPRGSHMMFRTDRPAVTHGQVTLVVQNMGRRTHEVVVLPLADGAVAGQRAVGSGGKVDETGSLGETSASCTGGAGEGITAGSAGWVTLNLPPGRYELVCNLTNHYAAGMYQELDVT